MKNLDEYPFEIRPLTAAEGGGYLISYPDFSECLSDGKTVEQAIANGHDYAFETTLGGNTIPATLLKAAVSHAVLMWFCGLDSPEHHLARVRFRVSQGGHDIPEVKIRERYIASIQHLIALLPSLTRLHVYDNSVDAIVGQALAQGFGEVLRQEARSLLAADFQR